MEKLQVPEYFPSWIFPFNDDHHITAHRSWVSDYGGITVSRNTLRLVPRYRLDKSIPDKTDAKVFTFNFKWFYRNCCVCIVMS